MSQFPIVVFSVSVLLILGGVIQSCLAASFPIPLDANARALIHISTRPRSAGSVFVDVKIEESNPRVSDARLNLSGIGLNVMRRKTTGEYETLASTRIEIWRKDGSVHAYFAIDPELIESSTLNLVLDAPDLPGENYHEVKLNEFIKRERK
jgi:hypothetical protein